MEFCDILLHQYVPILKYRWWTGNGGADTFKVSVDHLILTFWLSTTFRFRAEITNLGRSYSVMSLRTAIGSMGDVLMPVLAAVYECMCVRAHVCIFSHTYVSMSCVTASLHSKVLWCVLWSACGWNWMLHSLAQHKHCHTLNSACHCSYRMMMWMLAAMPVVHSS